MDVKVIYPSEKYFSGFYDTLTSVAKERIYIEMIEAPPFETVAGFQREHVANNGPVYYALCNDQVVGWCDVFAKENPRQAHRGSLGMGLLPEFRGKGIGGQLLKPVLDHSKKIGLEK